MDIEITSFGYLHGAPPAAHLTLDLRHHFRDPHVSPELRNLTAEDAAVREAVLNTPGIATLIVAAEMAVRAFEMGPSKGTIRVAVGCAGGRHRAATVAQTLASRLGPAAQAALVHRDLSKDVVNRDENGNRS
uniref:Nucleotide-binding protein n=1 Tax=Streptomyces phage Geonosis TaxID=3158856 RepID=A0AAU7GXV6_9CAUD